MTQLPTPPAAQGSVLGRYQLVRQIGTGGMGAVFEARHLELNKRVAIKALLPQFAAHEEVRARMLREGQAAAAIDHPHVVDIFDVGVQDNLVYLVMEYLEGHDLGQRLREGPPFTVEAAVDVVLPVLAGLSVAHDQGVLHRDLKPANVFLTVGPHGETLPKLLDFGIAKVAGVDAHQPLTSTNAVMGTPQYMSPEQVQAVRDVDARSDQYSMAVILHHCLTGKPPFSGVSAYAIMRDVVSGEFTPLESEPVAVPRPLCAIVRRAMSLSPEDRFDSVLAFGHALLPYASAPAQARWAPVFSVVPPEALSRTFVPGSLVDSTEAESRFAEGWEGVRSRRVPLIAVAGVIGLLVGLGGFLSARELASPGSESGSKAAARPSASEPRSDEPSKGRAADAAVRRLPPRRPPPERPPPEAREEVVESAAAASPPTPAETPSVREDPPEGSEDPPSTRAESRGRRRPSTEERPRRKPAPVELGTNDAPILE